MKRWALAFLLATRPLGAWEQLRLPWVFSDEPDLNADFGYSPGAGGMTHVDMALGGRFAGFGLPKSAARAPRLQVEAEFNAPGSIEAEPQRITATVDLADVLKEYGDGFARKYFSESSALVYKAELGLDLKAGDYNVAIRLHDPALGMDSHRTLHLIVPGMDPARWALGDLKFITAVGKRLDERGHEQRLLDPNPWRQVGGKLGWDLLVAYGDRGARPAGKLHRRHSIQRLRGEAAPIWQEEGDAPAKKAQQVWILRVPEAQVRAWQAGVYVLKVELEAGGRKAEASKTFEVLP